MEFYSVSSLVLLSIILTLLYLLFLSPKPSQSKIPPGPKPWPIIGNIHLLGKKPHQSVAKLSKIYGPLMSLKLGSMTTIVISSPAIAKEIFLKHDLAFASRQVSEAGKVANHYKHSIVFLPVCPKWRSLKKIATTQLFTNQRLDASEGIRRKKVDELVAYAWHCCQKGVAIDVGKAAFTTSLNLLSNTFFSSDLSSHNSSNSEFKDLVCRILEDGGRPNVSDLFPLLRHFDLQGVRRRTMGVFSKMLGIFDKIIDERLRDPIEDKDDVLGTLLRLVKEKELSLDDVKHMLMDLFIAGTDTTSNTLEWAMTELLRHPQKLAKAHTEINQVIGKQHGSVQESDISKLHYIQAVVKEVWRLHPPGPFLIPHKTNMDIQLRDYTVPKDAQVWVNLWSIGHDPSVWTNPESFEPERFLGRKIDVKGHNFELITFGAGRRMCPGIPLAYRMVHLMLANLLHSFNWKPPNGVNPADIDAEEKFGLGLQKLQPLLAIPFSR